MKIAIVGSRDYSNLDEVRKYVAEFFQPSDVLVSGGARGVDSVAEQAARARGIRCIIYKADWEKHGKQAGFLRNQDIVTTADRVVAFWDGKSKGTMHTINIAKNYRKPLQVFGPML